jgi:catechol 2,3-dioxygenase-like lactoylglutathione lyase family enzyme
VPDVLRSLVLLLAVATLVVSPPALGQEQTPDLSDLWTEYPLDPTQDDPRPAGSRERDASIWGPPPDEPQPAGPFAVALFYLALALGVLGIAGAIRALPILHFGGGASSARRVVADQDDDLGLHDGPEAGEQVSGDVDHIVIAVSDWERSNAFYRDVLGAEIVPLGPDRFAYAFGDQRLNVHGPGTDVGDLVARDPVRPGNSDLCLEWPGPIEKAVDHLHAYGVELEAGPVERAGGHGHGRSVYFRDPDGSLLELISYA